jgi:phosphoribosylanthranilate isomerase
VGFDFALSERQITVSAAHDILRRLPNGAVSVGVFRQELPQRVVEIANTLGLSAVQIDGPASLEDLAYIGERVNTLLRMVPGGATRLALSKGVDYVVLPEIDESAALVAALSLVDDAGPRVPVIASGGLNAENVADVVRNYAVYGVDVRAGVESAPGVKDPALLGEFIANARWAYDHSFVERHFDEWTL